MDQACSRTSGASQIGAQQVAGVARHQGGDGRADLSHVRHPLRLMGSRGIRLFRLRPVAGLHPRHRRQLRAADRDPALLAGGNGRRPAAKGAQAALRSGGTVTLIAGAGVTIVLLAVAAGGAGLGQHTAHLFAGGAADPTAGARGVLEFGPAGPGVGVDGADTARHFLACQRAAARPRASGTRA